MKLSKYLKVYWLPATVGFIFKIAEAFLELISDIRKTYEENKNEESLTFIKTMLEEIEILDKKSQPLIEQLQIQGISEKGWDSYYNLYLKSLYQFDGENIIFSNELQNRSSKGI